MKVGELIEQLKQVPAELRVVVRGYEDGVDDVNVCERVSISVDGLSGYDYYGMHALASEGKERHIQDTKGTGIVPALYIRSGRGGDPSQSDDDE